MRRRLTVAPTMRCYAGNSLVDGSEIFVKTEYFGRRPDAAELEGHIKRLQQPLSHKLQPSLRSTLGLRYAA